MGRALGWPGRKLGDLTKICMALTRTVASCDRGHGGRRKGISQYLREWVWQLVREGGGLATPQVTAAKCACETLHFVGFVLF